MIALSVALGLVGLAITAAIWDAWRRAIAAQVEHTRLRVEGMRREDLAELAARLTAAEGEIASLTSAVTFGRAKR